MSFQKTIFDTIGSFLVEKVEFILKQSISTNLILQGLYSCIIMSVELGKVFMAHSQSRMMSLGMFQNQ